MARGERPGRRGPVRRVELHDDESVGRKARDARSNSGAREAGRASSPGGNADADAGRHRATAAALRPDSGRALRGKTLANSDPGAEARTGGRSCSRGCDPRPTDGDASARTHGRSPGRCASHHHTCAPDRDARAPLADAPAPNGDTASRDIHAGPGDGDTSTDDRDTDACDPRASDSDADSDPADTDSDKAVHSGKADAYP
jgi:hypothetical protein